MSRRDWTARLDDILESITSIQSYVAGMTFATFTADRKTVRAAAYEIGVIGEAAGRIPPDVRQRYSEVPWDEMRRMRNVVIHEYFRVDEYVLWQTVTEDLPPLVPMLRSILDRERDGADAGEAGRSATAPAGGEPEPETTT